MRIIIAIAVLLGAWFVIWCLCAISSKGSRDEEKVLDSLGTDKERAEYAAKAFLKADPEKTLRDNVKLRDQGPEG